MTNEEYKEALAEIESVYILSKKNLYRDYAFSNNPHKIGDIIKDHSGYGRIEVIKFSGPQLGSHPQCVYLCAEVTVKMEPKKSGSKRQIWQSNIES